MDVIYNWILLYKAMSVEITLTTEEYVEGSVVDGFSFLIFSFYFGFEGIYFYVVIKTYWCMVIAVP